MKTLNEVARISSFVWEGIPFASATDGRLRNVVLALLDVRSPLHEKVLGSLLGMLLTNGHIFIEPQDQIRAWFLYGYVSMNYRDLPHAEQAFGRCADLMRQVGVDDATRVQVLLKRARLHQLEQDTNSAANDFLDILDILEKNPAVPFRLGSADVVLCHAHLQYAICLVRLGHFKHAFEHMEYVLRAINDWVERSSFDAVQQVLQNLGNPDEMSIIPPLDPLDYIDESLFEDETGDAASWLMQYNLAWWTVGWMILWACRLMGNDSKRKDELSHFLGWLTEQLQQNVDEDDNVDSFKEMPLALANMYKQSAGMSIMGIEAAYVLGEMGEILPHEVVDKVNSFFDVFLRVNGYTPKEQPSRALPPGLMLLDFYRDWWRVKTALITTGWSPAQPLPLAIREQLEMLVLQIKLFLPKTEEDNSPLTAEVAGRFLLLLGRIYEDLDDQTNAEETFRAALTIFDHDGISNRRLLQEEARYLLGEPSEFDDEELKAFDKQSFERRHRR